MIITEKKFYEEVLDLAVPQLKQAGELFAAGDSHGAAHVFREYVKSSLKCEQFFKIQFGGPGNGNAKPGESHMDVANRVIENKYISVNVPIDFGKDGKIDWFANPCYNKYKEWGLQFHRHHEWAFLGRAYRETGDEKYAEYFAKTARSWITEAEQYPEDPSPYKCLHWRTIECGIRMTRNWHYAIHSFIGSPSVSDEDWVLIFMSVWEHGHRLRNDYTVFNWLTMEMNGLLRIGILYDMIFKEAKEWREFALFKFIDEIDVQFHPDNLQVELTTGYHGVVINNYLWVVETLEVFGEEPPKKLLDGIHMMFKMYAQLVTPGGYTPALNDGSKAKIKDIYQKGIGRFPDDEVMKYFLSDRKEGKAPDFTTCIMPYAGMIAMRTGFGPDDMWAFFESAKFGASHQHEDKLNFLLYAYGTDMLPDSGTFRYDTSDMRKYILGTRAHNTGLVDGLPQNRRKTHKRPTKEYNNSKSNLRARLGEELEVAEGEYNDGYGGELLPAVHKRKVVFFKKGLSGSLPFFAIIDRYTADGEEHTFETSFQLTDAPICAKGNKVSAQYDTGAVLNLISSVFPKIYIGQYTPEYMGWRISNVTETRVHIPAPVLSYSVKNKSADIVTVLYPAPDGECPITDVTADESGFSITVNGAVEYFSYDDKCLETDEL